MMALVQVFSDSFTDTNGTLLTAHTPETGNGWDYVTNSASNTAEIQSNTLVQPFYSPSSDESAFTINVTESQTDIQACEMVVGDLRARLGLHLQNGTSGFDGYSARFNSGTNNIEIIRHDNSAETVLASDFEIINLGDTCRFESDGAGNLTVTVNGAGGTTFNDTTYIGGLPGVVIGPTFTTGGMDSFSAELDNTPATPVTFTGPNIDDVIQPVNDAINIATSDRFTGNIDPITYSFNGAQPGLTINSVTGVITSQAATKGSRPPPYIGIVVRATDNDLNTADSNAFNITWDEAEWGIRGDEVPSAGDDGASIMFASLDLPADAAKRFRLETLTEPASGLWAIASDGSGSLIDAVDGVYTSTHTLYEDDLALPGVLTSTYSIGDDPFVKFDINIVAPVFGFRLETALNPISFNFTIEAPNFGDIRYTNSFNGTILSNSFVGDLK